MDFQDSIARVAHARRILVLGSPGSGKTTFSIRLARNLNLETIHLDAQFWKPGWIATPQPQWRERVTALIQRPEWIMDGTYENSLDLRIPAANAIILIECSRSTCLWRAVKRRLTVDDQHRPDAPDGQRLEPAFLKYIWQYPDVTGPFVAECIRQYGSDKTIVPLRGSGEIRQFLRQIQQQKVMP